MKKAFVLFMIIIAMGSFGFAAGRKDTGKFVSDGKVLTINFWTAPNQGQYNFWDSIIQQFNAAGIEVDGKTVQVKAQMMPETPSSEAGIQNALATNTIPALSTNINRGFATTLVTAGRVYDLKNDKFFTDIISARHMDQFIDAWQIDGGQYVLPIYANAMGYHWNSAALRELGFADRVPTTVDDIKTLIRNFENLKDTRMKDLGISHIFLRSELGRPELWWNRWYDFEMQYDAFSGGKSLVDNNELVMDKDATKKVFEFLGMFGDTIQMSEDLTAFDRKNPAYVVQVTAPWDVAKYDAAGLTYGLDGDYVYGPPIVLKEGDTPYTFADAKGIVFYKGGNITEEMHKGAVAFISWVYAAERNAQIDLSWLKTTGMLPMRGDIIDNPVFAAYIGERKVLQDQAKLIAHSIPAMANSSMSDILTALGEDGLCDYILSTTKMTPFSAPDASLYVERAVAGMKSACSL